MSRVSKFVEATARYVRCRATGRPLSGDFRRDPVDAIRLLTAGEPVRTIFDVGGNKGQSVLAYRRRFPTATVYSFEPEPGNFELLRRRVKGLDKVVPVQAAVSDSCGTGELVLTDHSTMHSLLRLDGDAADRRIPIRTVTLDAFAAEHGLPGIDVLKMDVQGGELTVLAGAAGLLSRGAIGTIYTEVMFAPCYVGQPYGHEIAARLHEFGYRPFGFYELRYNGTHGLNHGNMLFVSPGLFDRHAARMAA